MMFIPGLRRELRVLAFLLTAYFMSQTWTVSAVSNNTVLATKSTNAITTQISPTSTTSTSSPTSRITLPTSSTITKASIKPSATPTETGRKFDGASFVGGIILGVVLTIIFLLAFKWWQSRNKSYHSL